MKTQIILIHGGDSFDTYEAFLSFLKKWKIDFKDYQDPKSDWKETLRGEIGDGFEVIRPSMPNKRNAKYEEWKIWFEKFIPYFESYVLVGHSLGGLFLAKYLSENTLPKKPIAVFLVAAPYGEGDFPLSENISPIQDQGKVFLYHSEDDPVVPFADLEKYASRLNTATKRVFKDRGHFGQEKLPELIEDIRLLAEVKK